MIAKGDRACSASLQDAKIRKKCPSFKLSKHGNLFRWRGTIKPGSESNTYSVRIDLYQDKKTVKVFIDDPVLHELAPHRYKDKSLCLFYPWDPNRMTWKPNMHIADTLIPWTAWWLYCYEYWLDTGVWMNSEANHTDEKDLIPE